jgi:hypothetical protein
MTRLILTLAITALGFSGAQSAAAQVERTETPRSILERSTRPGLSAATSLAVTVGYAEVEYDINQPFAHAKTATVPVTVKFSGPVSVASLQTGPISIPLGTRKGSFEQTVAGVDIRSIMATEAPAILERCTAVLGHNKVEAAAYAYDAQLAFTANAPDGAVVASTTVPYQLGLICKRIPPLAVVLGYTKIAFSLAQPLAHATGGQIPVTVKYNGAEPVSSLQVGTISMPLGAHSGSFEQTVPNVDVRAVLNQEEASIREVCQSVLDYNKVAEMTTAYDASLPMTVNGPNGAVVASATVPYQLTLTCRR